MTTHPGPKKDDRIQESAKKTGVSLPLPQENTPGFSGSEPLNAVFRVVLRGGM
jgi:hypothetical protein